MVAADGGVFAFGDAKFAGRCPGIGGCAGPAVAVMPDASGNGYWLITKTGTVYTFGDAPLPRRPGAQSSPITSATATPDGKRLLDPRRRTARCSPTGTPTNLGNVPAGATGGLNPATAIFATSDERGLLGGRHAGQGVHLR